MLELARPRWFLAENVGGLQSANEGRAFDVILRALFEAGYDLFPNFYHFERYGVPQARHRVIIVGIRRDLGLRFGIPSPAPFVDVDVSCRSAIERPPIAPDAFNNEPTRQGRAVVERLQYIRPGENAFTAHLPPHLQLQIQGARISQIYKRLDPDRPAYTVTGSGGGGTHMYHWTECRARASRKRGIFSNDWKHFFQSLEKCRKIFPIVGKNGRNFPTIGKFFSNHWKTPRRARMAA